MTLPDYTTSIWTYFNAFMSWEPIELLAAVGAAFILGGIALAIFQRVAGRG